MSTNQYNQPTRLDLLIDGVTQATLIWSSATARWDGGIYRMQYSGAVTEGFVIYNTNNGNKLADSTTSVSATDDPRDIGDDGKIRTDGKVGYKVLSGGSTSNWYEIKSEGGSTAGDSSGNPLGSGSGNGDPHISPLFGEKYDL